jgi:hypothetical protein
MAQVAPSSSPMVVVDFSAAVLQASTMQLHQQATHWD